MSQNDDSAVKDNGASQTPDLDSVLVPSIDPSLYKASITIAQNKLIAPDPHDVMAVPAMRPNSTPQIPEVESQHDADAGIVFPEILKQVTGYGNKDLIIGGVQELFDSLEVLKGLLDDPTNDRDVFEKAAGDELISKLNNLIRYIELYKNRNDGGYNSIINNYSTHAAQVAARGQVIDSVNYWFLLMNEANIHIQWLKDAIEDGDTLPESESTLATYRDYRRKLRRIDYMQENTIWPYVPFKSAVQAKYPVENIYYIKIGS